MPTDNPVNNRNPSHILIADDSQVNLKVTSYLLQKLGYMITTVKNGRQALDLLVPGHAFSAFLTDGNMPVMNGQTAVRLLRERERQNNSPRLPVIALTGSILTSEIDDFIAAGLDAIILKPIHADELAEKLRNLIK